VRRTAMARLRAAVVVVVLAGLGVVLAPAAPACACSCAMGTLDEYVADADAVFVGTVREVRPPWYPPWQRVRSSSDPMTAVIEVSEVYKGARVTTWTEVETASSGASCGFEFVEGHRYLVFARHDDGTFTTSLCSGNRDLALEANPFPTRGQDPTAGSRPGWWTAERITVVGGTTGAAALLAVTVGLLALRRRRRAGTRPE
jgi:hypothetical protein